MSYKFQTLPKNPDIYESWDVSLCNEFSLPTFGIDFIKQHSASFQAREDDVYIVSYPKTGTTWLQEIVYLLYNSVDIESAKQKGSMEKVPYIEHRLTDVDSVVNMTSPRLLKTHFPYSLLPPDIINKKCKLIYITRNPKDVVVSYYHFAKFIIETSYKGTFDNFFERFIADRATYSPFLQHNLEFWNLKNEPNVLFLFYEDMIKNSAESVSIIANFLEKPVTDDDVEKIVSHCSFDSMAKEMEKRAMPTDSSDPKKGKFFRKGKVGDWKIYFSQEQCKRMDLWVQKTLGSSDLEYTYELPE